MQFLRSKNIDNDGRTRIVIGHPSDSSARRKDLFVFKTELTNKMSEIQNKDIWQ